MNTIRVVTCCFLLMGATAFVADAEDEGQKPVDKDHVYLLNTCPVSGQELGSMGEPVAKVYDGQEVRFCCGGCPAKFEADKEQYTKKIEQAVIEQQKDAYPVKTCPISGEELGSMGEPVDRVYGNRLVRFCCSGCVGKFEKDLAANMKKLDEAVAEAQKDDYPLTTCVVSGKELGGMGEPVNFVIGNQLVRLCCPGCESAIKKDPQKYLSRLEKGEKE